MKIKEVTDTLRNDFWAIYECEHCGHTEKGCGYDDGYFHNVVIPNKKCRSCGRSSAEQPTVNQEA